MTMRFTGDTKPQRKESIIPYKTLTDVTACLITLLKMYFKADPHLGYTGRAETSNLVITGKDYQNSTMSAEKYPLVLVSTTGGAFRQLLISDRVAQQRTTSTGLRMAHMQASAVVEVMAFNSIEADILATKISFFLWAYRDIVRNLYEMDIESIQYSAPTASSSRGGKNLYTVAISISFMLLCKWSDRLVAPDLAELITTYKMEGSPEFDYNIIKPDPSSEDGTD